ncbi:non-SMC mitotic condensation complex subunit 1-domain-containing protein [Russula emetica]|nr:non-SMC mitotic condensation complex subunit 1-domain-containing protein [Russula emetica]
MDPTHFLALYGLLLIRICGRPDQFKNTTLRAVATLSFSKILCVSSPFCDANHQLLSRILETSTIVDENSDELYKGLSDQDLVVKKNTLMVLTHLILNGMIKVKGQLGEMAKCLEDKEPHISRLANTRWTKKASNARCGTSSLSSSIVEKLCQRFRLTEDTRQWRDIAFCLSLLPFKSECSGKKLIEGLPFYRDKLHEDKY